MRIFSWFLFILILLAMLGTLTGRPAIEDIKEHGLKGFLECLWEGPESCKAKEDSE